MTDDRLDPEQEEQVRALLADLGSAPDASSMPPEVAARLDETLAGLVAERGESSESAEPATVVPLRRRWAPRAAAAAAAVIVVGAGGVAAANLGIFGGADSANDQATSGSAAGGSRAESLDSGASSAAPSGPGAVPEGAARLPKVSAASFDTDVARLLRRLPALSGELANDRKAAADQNKDATPLVDCPGPQLGHGSTTVTVLYDGSPVALVFHPAHGDSQLVEAWTCTGDHRLDSTSVATTQETSGEKSPDTPGLGSPTPTP